jgi:hypothetical protein
MVLREVLGLFWNSQGSWDLQGPWESGASTCLCGRVPTGVPDRPCLVTGTRPPGALMATFFPPVAFPLSAHCPLNLRVGQSSSSTTHVLQ